MKDIPSSESPFVLTRHMKILIRPVLEATPFQYERCNSLLYTHRPLIRKQMVGDLLESLGLWPFTVDLGWTVAQFDLLMTEVRRELQDVDLKLYIDMSVGMHAVGGRAADVVFADSLLGVVGVLAVDTDTLGNPIRQA